MQTYDITLTVHPGMPVWPGDPPVTIERVSKIEEGASANVTSLATTVHAGTHVDAPFHFLGGDAKTIDQLPLKVLTGRAYVCRVPDEVDLITAEVLQNCQIPARTKRILFKTRNSYLWEKTGLGFQEDFVAISPDGAQYLIARGVQLVGVDYLSVAPYADGVPTHKLLLESNIVIVEGLDLSQVSQGRYSLYCLPLKISGSDGAPARAILVGA